MSDSGTIRSIPLTVHRQERPEWCWAAVSVSVDQFFRPGSTHTQCELAGDVLGLTCCVDGKPSPTDLCNVPHELNPVLGRLHLLAQDPIVKALTFDEVQKEIDAGRPVCVLIKWLDNQGQVSNRGHFITIGGYRVTPAQKQYVSIGDPLYGASEIDFAQFSNSKGGYRDGRGVWYASFLVQNEAAS